MRGSLATIKETEIFHISERQANLQMALSCLEHLKQSIKVPKLNRINVNSADTLLQYSAPYWYSHARVTSNRSLQALISSLFTSEGHFASWLSVWDPDNEGRPREKAQRPSPLYYACLLGFYDLARALLAEGAAIDQTGGESKLPLLVAIDFG